MIETFAIIGGAFGFVIAAAASRVQAGPTSGAPSSTSGDIGAFVVVVGLASICGAGVGALVGALVEAISRGFGG